MTQPGKPQDETPKAGRSPSEADESGFRATFKDIREGMSDEKEKDEYLRDKRGRPIRCMHRLCWRNAVRIVAWESPRHKEFAGQTHDCCAIHSRRGG